uniref:Homeobox domain-containing protein n=2 Tax=Oryza punctata TaxID=4537 RepID=A0A0E0K848_ORYPU
MAHHPSLGFADYFSAADASASSITTLMPAMDEAAPELFGLQAGMELLGVRGLGMSMMPGATGKVTALVDAGGGDHDDDDGSTMRFLSEQHQQPSQAPLSLSLCRPDGVLHLGGAARQHQLAPAAPWMMHHGASSASNVHGAWHLRSSRFLLPVQQLLQEFCSLPVDSTKRSNAKAAKQQEDGRGDGSSSSSASWTPSPQIQAMEALELQRLKDKLYIMLEEVDRRYRRYCEQMRAVAGGFEAVAGERAAAAYTAVAARTISRHFRSLRDGIVAQLQAVRKALGEKDVSVAGTTRGQTPRLKVIDQCIRHHKSLGVGVGGAAMDGGHPWRPQRGLPERAVTILRAWLFEHFLHPYPSDVDKHILARQTGLSRSQVSNWFINARVRLWKPMVEEMYVEEMKDQDGGDNSGGQGSLNPKPTCSRASEARGGQQLVVGDGTDGDAGEQKPTRAQLRHDAGSLASVVNVDVARAGGGGGVARLHQAENFGIMDHLDFDAYDDSHEQQQQHGGPGGVSLTLGLQQHGSHGGGGVNIAFGAPGSTHGGAGFLYPGEQMVDAVHPGHGHHHVVGGQFGVAMDGDASHAQESYRSLSAGFHLLRDLAGVLADDLDVAAAAALATRS